MIVKICGRVCEINDNSLVLDVNGICYEILVATTILQRIATTIGEDKTICLITYHYYQIEGLHCH